MAKVICPNKDYEGISAGVKFSKGIGECTDPYLIGWFKDKGYTVDSSTEEEEPETKPKRSRKSE